MTNFIIPDWPAPEHVKALTTTRVGGVSTGPYDSFNLGDHVGDNSLHVNQNRTSLLKQAELPEPPRWLSQNHGCRVVDSSQWVIGDQADAIVSHTPNHVCPILTADCLPILLCNKQGDNVAAIHAGWRGLANGIIEQTIAKLSKDKSELMAWLGPAIGPEQFEVGPEVVDVFVQHNALAQYAFQQTDDTHYLANIYLLARQRLQAVGVSAIYGGQFCTVTESKQFFSYRRDTATGRMASIIWIAPH